MQRLVSILHLLAGLVCSVVALPFIQLLLFDPDTSAGIKTDGQVFVLLSLLFFWPSVLLGLWGLVHFRTARWPLIALGGLYLLLFPLGTLLGGVTLAATLRPPVAAKARNSDVERILGVVLAMGMTGSAIVLGLVLLFAINRTPQPQDLAMLALPAGIVLPISLLLFLRRVNWSRDPFNAQLRKRQHLWREEEAARRQAEEVRVANLFADLATRSYAEAIERGDYWSDDTIAYDRNPDMLVTDAALQPIEAAMRRAGIVIRRGFGSIITARCRIDGEALYAVFPPHDRYSYTDTYHFDRSYDPDEAVIITASGMSYIHVVHPRSGDDVPVFPSPTVL